MILLKYHALLLFLKKRQNLNCRLLQIIGGTLWVNFACWVIFHAADFF